MPLDVRSIAISVAVMFFFILGLVGWFGGLSPFTCCKRSVIGAMAAYIAASYAVKVINAVLLNAIIQRQLKEQQERSSDSED